MKKYGTWIVVLSMLLAAHVLAAPADSLHFQADSSGLATSANLTNQPYSINIVSVALRALLSLAGIIVLIFVTILVLKKLVFQQRTPPEFANAVSVLGTVPISPKKNIQLIKMVDRILVIAVTESNVSLLTEIDDAHVLEMLKPSAQGNTNVGLPFKQYLSKMLGKSDES
ncbi:flagellar biosynthetic protein FliO [candidate division KSB1 bacterium]|nr:flagellar biosynthetic protein FliO [candidate division KSB1 bacterium]